MHYTSFDLNTNFVAGVRFEGTLYWLVMGTRLACVTLMNLLA